MDRFAALAMTAAKCAEDVAEGARVAVKRIHLFVRDPAPLREWALRIFGSKLVRFMGYHVPVHNGWYLKLAIDDATAADLVTKVYPRECAAAVSLFVTAGHRER